MMPVGDRARDHLRGIPYMDRRGPEMFKARARFVPMSDSQIRGRALPEHVNIVKKAL